LAASAERHRAGLSRPDLGEKLQDVLIEELWGFEVGRMTGTRNHLQLRAGHAMVQDRDEGGRADNVLLAHHEQHRDASLCKLTRRPRRRTPLYGFQADSIEACEL